MVKETTKSLVLSVVLALPVAFGGCWGETGNPERPAEGDLVMKAYDVPAPYGPEIGGILRALLWRGEDAPMVGQVETSPSGQVLVAAPKGFHAGVEQFLNGLKKAPPTPPPSIQLDYWIVLGRPPEQAETDPAPDPHGPAAEALKIVHKLQPAMHLALLERLTLTSLSGEKAQSNGAQASVSHSATLFQDKVLAKLDIRPNGRNSGPPRVPRPLDPPRVRGQAGSRGGGHADPFTGEPMQGPPPADRVVFYVIRASTFGNN